MTVAAVAAGPALDLDDLQSRGIDLGLERLPGFVSAPDLVATVVDPETVHLPAPCLRHRLHGLAGLPPPQGDVAIVIGHRNS